MLVWWLWWLGVCGYSKTYCSLQGFRNIGQGLKSLNATCVSYQGWWVMGTAFCIWKKTSGHERMVGRKPYLLGNLEALRRCFTYTRSFRWCHRYSSSLLGSDEHVQSVHGHRVRLFVTSCLYQQVFWWWLDMVLRFERDHLWKASFNLGQWYRWVGQQGGGKPSLLFLFFAGGHKLGTLWMVHECSKHGYSLLNFR